MKKFLSVLLAAVLVFSAVPFSGLSEYIGGLDFDFLTPKASAASYSGTCGTYVNWSLDTETGVLTISGSGAMRSYYSSSSSAPWHSKNFYIKSVVIQNGVTSIGDRAFYNCSNLTSVTIPDSVTSIGDYAFYYCRSLTSVTIPDSVTSIGDEAFRRCDSLTSVTIPDSVTSIGNYAFCNCSSLTSVTIPDSVTSIGDYAFDSCSSLTSVTIPDSVTSISNSAFCWCDSLTSVTIPDSVTSIGEEAFRGCSSLTSVTIPDSVTSIGGSAFNNCSSLNAIYITDLDAWCSISFGDYCANPLYCAHNLYINGEFATDIVIPDSVTSIGNYAFYYCDSLTSVTIPNSVTSIGGSAFGYCSSLTLVTIPDSVTSIGSRAFEYCDSLTSVTIPDSVTSIGNYAFCNCRSLTSVTIPDSVTSIGIYAFENCNPALTIYGYKNSEAERYAKVEEIKFIALPALPGTVKLAKIENAAAGVTVTWSAVKNAESYIVYRKAGSATSWSRLAVVGDGATSYTDKNVTSGTSYTYTVRAQNADGTGDYNKTGLKTVYLSQPAVTAANKNGYVNVNWGKITGATGYIVYRKASGETGWSRLASVTGNATVSYNDKTVKSGIAYRYTVRACKGSYSSSYSSTGALLRYLAQPTVTVANANGSVTVKWSKVAGAKGYYIYRKAGGAKSWSRLATISSGTTVAYTDKKVASGTAYQYTVRAINATYASSYCAGAATRYIAAGKMASAASTKTGIALKWAKTAGANGYVVYRKVGSGAWAKLVTVKGNATVSYLDKSAKKGTTYTYCVRPYNGSFAGVYANTVSCKDKY